MKALLTVTAVVEAIAGLALASWPPVPVTLLLGSSLDGPVAPAVARVAGAALLALGLACWLARRDGRSRAALGLVAAMLLYNAAVMAILASAGLVWGLVGLALWPAVVLHAALAAWCIVCLRSRGATARDAGE